MASAGVRSSRRWSRSLLIALAFLIIGMFIDAIPAIIIMGTILLPMAQHAGMHPIHFALIGVISLAFGLVTPPYGLCLLIAASIGQIKVVAALRDVGIILVPMLLRQWRIDQLEGLSGEAEQAREHLMKYLAKSERVARRLAERKESSLAAV